MSDDSEKEKAVEFLEKQLAEQGFTETGLRHSLARLGAGIAMQAAAQSPPVPAPKSAKSPKSAPAKKLVQLGLSIPEKTRPVSNIAARAALFAAIQGEDREFFNKAVLTSQDGIKIIFSGLQLNQDDHDTFMQLVYMGDHKQLGEYVNVPANAILAGLGRRNGGKDHEQLKNEIHRLVTGTVNIKANGINFIGHFLESAVQDEREPQHKRNWSYRLNPEMASLFSRSQFTLIDWEQRKSLKQKDLARWLHLYICSHAAPFPVSVSFLHKICGSRTKALKKFRENLRTALESLKEVGIITSWRIEKESDLVYVEREPSVPQLRHLDQAEVSPVTRHNSFPLSPCAPDRPLKPAIVEKFRKLYPRLDPYSCKEDFDEWLQGKKAPRSYDAAFLGFAAKWNMGK